MLDRAKIDCCQVEMVESEWQAMTKVERRLINLFRRLSELEQKQIRRLSEALFTNPEEPAGN